MTETRQPVACACCGWTGKRATGKPVTCPKCGAWAAFQWQEDQPKTMAKKPSPRVTRPRLHTGGR